MAGGDNPESTPRLFPAGVLRSWFLPVLVLLTAGGLHVALTRTYTIADYFLLRDLPALATIAALLIGLRLGKGGVSLPKVSPRLILAAAVVFVLAAGTAGWSLVFHGYALTQDEFWASFDATIFRRGELLARVPEAWRPWTPALQPMWRMEVAGATHWGSLYLPVNAAAHALFGLVGAEALASPVFAAVGVVATFAVARRLWPERTDAAVVAALLVAASPQVLVASMTPYAMSGHLALNMVWLWLFLRDRPGSHACAILVGFAACGLHQLAFHPLFVGPFLLELFLARRWRLGLTYVAAYGVILVFWVLYWSLLLKVVGAAPAASTGIGASFFVARIAALFRRIDPYGPAVIAKSLLRFVAWQHPLLVPLAAVGTAGGMRSRGLARPLTFGLALTLATMLITVPNQGYGWGYRYLHGLIGGFALLAAQGWIRLSPGRVFPASATGFAISTAFVLVVLLPLQILAAQRLVAPYSRAYAAIRRTDADVVIVDAPGLLYVTDLVRNDPFMRNRPKVMDLGHLTPEQLHSLCRHGPVGVFDRSVGLAYGIRSGAGANLATDAARRAQLRQPGCRIVTVSPPFPSAS